MTTDMARPTGLRTCTHLSPLSIGAHLASLLRTSQLRGVPHVQLVPAGGVVPRLHPGGHCNGPELAHSMEVYRAAPATNVNPILMRIQEILSQLAPAPSPGQGSSACGLQCRSGPYDMVLNHKACTSSQLRAMPILDDPLLWVKNPMSARMCCKDLVLEFLCQ